MCLTILTTSQNDFKFDQDKAICNLPYCKIANLQYSMEIITDRNKMLRQVISKKGEVLVELCI